MVTVPLLPLDQIIDLYPALSQVQPTLAEIGAALQPYQVPTDTVLFAENTACQGFPLVKDAFSAAVHCIGVRLLSLLNSCCSMR